MFPAGPAATHPAADLLRHYATHGVPSNCGDDWDWDMIEATIRRGAHPSARTPDAITELHRETHEQVANGYATVITLDQLRSLAPPNVKISPCAAIPHKTRKYRKLLDLSWALDGLKSVNASTDLRQAPLNAMNQLGKVLPRLIHTLATTEDPTPLLFAKLDIKDGFWRVVMNENDRWNHAYVLPQRHPGEDVLIVIPTSIQMGWTLSPPFFCAATETARDVGEDLANQPPGSLPTHPDEDEMHGPRSDLPRLKEWTEGAHDAITRLLEVYVDDFIGLISAHNEESVKHFSRAMLHAIHSVFPPPDITDHKGEDPISRSKLKKGEGLWQTRKEILGWILDGLARTIELPPDKVEKLQKMIQKAKRSKGLRTGDFLSLRGKLRHATIGLPAGKGIVGPLDRVQIHDTNGSRLKWIPIKQSSLVWEALTDFATLLRQIGSRPTHCKELVAGLPSYLGYSDASRDGGGGVWTSGTDKLQPTVWRLEWPDDIKEAFDKNILSINDLEAATVLLHWLVLEQLADIKHKHVGTWCDNTSSVSWFTKMKSKRSSVGQRLVRALCLRMAINEASPLATLSIAGKVNNMADDASRWFQKFHSDDDFLLTFASSYPYRILSGRCSVSH